MDRTPISSSELRKLFQKDFPEIYELASSNDFKGFDENRPVFTPNIEDYDKVYITENRSIADYLRQLRDMGERLEEYKDIWGYIHSETERRDPAFEYPDFDFRVTGELSNFAVR